MSVDIAVGDGLLLRPSGDYGFWGWTTATENVAVTAANPTNPRIDTVVAWIDTNVTTTGSANSPNALKFQVMAGTPAGSPTAMADATIQSTLGAAVAWIKLATLLVPAGSSSVVNANISDVRIGISSLINGVNDANGNEVVRFSSVASAVNEVSLTNAVTGSGPTIGTTGSDANVDLNFAPKGTGKLKGLVNNLHNPYKFSVYRSATLNTASGQLAIVFDTVEYDTASAYNTSNGRFTAPVTGYYHFSAFVAVTTGGLQSNDVYLAKNGTKVKQGAQITFSSNTTGFVVAPPPLSLSAGDYIQAYVGSTAVAGMATGPAQCYFGGYLVSGA